MLVYDILVEPANHYIGVDTNLLRSNVCCTFLGQQQTDEKFCSIAFSPEEVCMTNFVHRTEDRGNASHFLSVELPELPQNIYCYIISASNETFTAKVEGKFNAGMQL